MFQVRTRAPRGMQDSALSAKLAFVENKTEEIAAVKTALATNNMGLGDEFSEELVNKGMLADDVEGLVDEMYDFSDSMDSVDSFEDMIAALRALVEEADNIEALVSAFVKTELVGYLEEMIEDLEYEIKIWEEEITYEYSWYDDYIQENIDTCQMQIDAYEDLINQIEDDPDSIVLAITSTINYFISVEKMISDDLVSLIDGVVDEDNPSNLTAAELLDIKTEIVYVLKETIPSEEEVILVMELVELLNSLSGTTINYDTAVENYKGKMAAQALYTIEAFTNFLDVFDEDFFDEFLNFVTNEELSFEMINAEMVILVVEYFNTFYDNNQDLLDTIDAVFSDEEQELLFDEYSTMLEGLDGQEAANSLISSLSFAQLLNLQIIFEDSFGALLDAFVESDGEIVRQLTILQGYSMYGMVNYATGETYANETRTREASELTTYDLASEVCFILDAFLQSMDTDDFGEMTNFLLDSVFEVVMLQVGTLVGVVNDESPFSENEALDAKDAVKVGLDTANEDLLTFLQDLLEYLVDEDVMQEFKVVLADVHTHYSDEYGTNYDEEYNSERYMDDYRSNAGLVFIAGVYDDFMNNSNRGTLDDILDVVFNTWRENELLDISGFSSADVTDIQGAIADVLDLLNDEFSELKDLDYTDLDADDLKKLEDFQTAFEEAMLAFYNGEEMY